ncbi:LytR C-terminal domain-containing protein [Duganella sp. CT11-25]|jgi:hypothetical protein|uniref:LytR C-terminal domain-containing protein n=1 Tax=unclassified Duganella TaxID=2636909 RepID=UPI0039B06007
MKKTLGAACAGALLMACGGMQTTAMAPVEADITALERTCVRDPLDPANWEQLAAVLAAGGERERAATMYLQAATLRAHDIRDDYARLKEELKEERKDARVAEAAAMPRTQVRRIGAALVEVLRIPASGAAQAPLPPAAAPGSAVIRLEISNGNGVAGAAARLARSLDGDGLKTVRLTNVRPFTVPLSRIEYQREQTAMARQLGQRLGLPLHRLRGNPAYADMRIVLGHDVRYLK